MSWSIVEVARMSGVTARTLRHYDHVGLLPPAFTAPGGRRYYEQADLLRLQRILLLRELGMGLEAISESLRDEDAVGSLQRHLDWLLCERDRYERLIGTVRATIHGLERGGDLTVDGLFAGFEQNPYEAEVRERWGDAIADATAERMRTWSAGDADRARTGFERVHAELARLRDAGAAADDERVQDVVDHHYATVSLFWTPDARAYRGLGDLYVEDERFRRSIGGGDDALVAFLRDAMGVYAEARLS